MIKAITSAGCSNTKRKRLLRIRDYYVNSITTMISLSLEYSSFILSLALPFHYHGDCLFTLV